MKDHYFLVVVSAVVCTVCREAKAQNCSSTDDIMKCLSYMPALTQDLTREELDRVCLEINRGLRCIDNYTRRCMTEEHHRQFHHMYKGTTQFYENLCQPGPYQREYLSHAPCIQQVKDDHDNCYRTYQQNIGEVHAKPSEQDRMPANETSPEDDSKMRTVCCSLRDFLGCSHRIVMEKCGEQSAKFTEGFLNQMSFSLMQEHCERYPHDSGQCQGSSASRNSLRALLFPVSLAIVSLFALRPT